MFLLFAAALAAPDATPKAAADLWRKLAVDPWSAASLDGAAWTLMRQPAWFEGEGEPYLKGLQPSAVPVIDSKRTREILSSQGSEVEKARAAHCRPIGPATSWVTAEAPAPADWLVAWPERADLRTTALVQMECADRAPRSLALTESVEAGWRVAGVVDEASAKRWVVLGLSTAVDLTRWRAEVAAQAAEAAEALAAAQARGVKRVHWSDAQVKVKKTPVFPEEAKRLGLTRSKCTAQVVVDATGLPESVTFPDCTPPYIESARAAAMEWRWYPTKVDGVAIPIVFNFAFTYVQKL